MNLLNIKRGNGEGKEGLAKLTSMLWMLFSKLGSNGLANWLMVWLAAVMIIIVSWIAFAGTAANVLTIIIVFLTAAALVIWVSQGAGWFENISEIFKNIGTSAEETNDAGTTSLLLVVFILLVGLASLYIPYTAGENAKVFKDAFETLAATGAGVMDMVKTLLSYIVYFIIWIWVYFGLGLISGYAIKGLDTGGWEAATVGKIMVSWVMAILIIWGSFLIWTVWNNFASKFNADKWTFSTDIWSKDASTLFNGTGN